jgi:site-specific recombinase XerD
MSEKRKPKKLPKILSREDVKKILAVPNVKCVTGLRNRVILQILYRAGLRVEEVCNLTPADIIFPKEGQEEGFIYVQLGKESKDRYVVIDAETVAWLQLWDAKRIPGPYLFMSHRGKKLDQSYIRKFCYQYSEKAGVYIQDGHRKAKVHPHTFRACYATERLEEGKNIIYIQEQLGHADLSTTRIYTQVRPSHLKYVAQNIEPIGGLPA